MTTLHPKSRSARNRLFPIRTTLAAILGATLLSHPATAQKTLTTEDFLNMLQNKVPATETSLTPEQLQAQTRNRIFVEQAGSGRDITVEDRNRLADIARDRPNADMEVTFTYDSATITPEATGLLIRLGRALADTRLASDTFMVAGHTDARGADDYNQRLSQRRAQAVKDFLVSNFDIAPRSLIAVGYGEEQLKNRYTPEAAENRRVQVVNMVSEVGQSSR